MCFLELICFDFLMFIGCMLAGSGGDFGVCFGVVVCFGLRFWFVVYTDCWWV